MERPLSWKEAEFEGSINFKILDVQPASGAGTLPNEQREGRAKKSRLDSEDHFRLPEHLAQHHRKASQHEGDEMHYSLDTRRPRWDIQGRSINHRLARRPFRAIRRAAVIVADTPCWIVGRGSDYADLVSTLREPGRHLTRILANSGKFRGVVQSVDQDSQTLPFIGTVPRVNSFCS